MSTSDQIDTYRAQKLLNSIRRAAYEADDNFSAELRRAYGTRGQDMRYRSSWDDPGVARAAAIKVAMDQALRVATGAS